jgi:serine/threonine-protein kinase RsbT
MAAAAGFTGIAIEELVLVVSELVSNALKYGGGGQLELTHVDDETRGSGITISVEDTAPPFDLERALPDGHDARGQIDPAHIFGRRGIGAGLGAVMRLTEGVRLEPTVRGKRLVATRFVKNAASVIARQRRS